MTNPKEKSREQAVSASEYSFAVNLMKFLVLPTFVLDAEGKVLIWNKACERLTDLPAEQVVGTKEHWRGFYDSPRPCLADLIVQHRTTEIDALYAAHDLSDGNAFGEHAENWCKMPLHGQELYLAIDAGPIYDVSGKLLAVVETLRDMTVQKKAQLELERLATHDGLTGVVNRRGFDTRLRAEWSRSMREQSPLSLLMLDVDFFKKFNDAYGHQAGDDCLKKVAIHMAKAACRPSDLIARYGGEEFVVVMPATDENGARVVAERVRQAITELAIPHASGVAGIVSASIGVATLVPSRDSTEEMLIGRADAALYEAKHQGRDRVVTAHQT